MIVSFRQLGFIVFAGFAALLSWRSLEGDEDVRGVAGSVACQGTVCEPTLQKSKRTLFGWELDFKTYGSVTEVVEVHCTRSLWLVGAYDCHVAGSNTQGDHRFD